MIRIGSDDDERLQLVSRYFRSRTRARKDSAFPVSTYVYDIRRKTSVVFRKELQLDVTTDSFSSISLDIKETVAKTLGVSEECISTWTERCVIHDAAEHLIIFINFHSDLDDPSLRMTGYLLGCIGLPPDTSIHTLKSIIRENERFHKGKSSFLFYKGNRLDDDSLTVGSLFKNGEYVSCFVSSNVTIACYHSPKVNVENKYTMQCSQASSIGEMKHVFKKVFWQEFPGLKTGDDDVWFSVGKHLAKEDEYYCIDQQKRTPLQERGRLVVHVKPVGSFPITVKIDVPGVEHAPKVLLVSSPLTTAALRQEISSLAEYPPSALRLLIKNKRLKEMTLSETMGFQYKCVVTAKVTKKIRVFIKLKVGGQEHGFVVKLFKLDTVQRLKEIIQEGQSVAVSQVQMFFEGKEMENANLMQDYHVRAEDTIHANIFHQPVYLSVRQPGRETLHLTVNCLQSTVGKVKIFLADQFGSQSSKISIIHRSKCLEDNETLEESGLVSGSTVLIPRLAQLDETEKAGIMKVYIAKEDGTFQKTFAVEAGKVLFYAPDSIPFDLLERKMTESVPPAREFHCGIMVRKLPPETRRTFQHVPCHQNEVSLYPLQQGSGPSTSNSSTESLMQGTCSLAVQANTSRQRTIPNRISFQHPGLFDHYSDPESSHSKVYSYYKECRETPERIVIREQSEINVPKGDTEKAFSNIAQTPSVQSPESMMPISPEHRIHRSPSLQFPVCAIQDCVLRAVSQQLGNNWKRVALELGLNHTDTEDLEYKYSRSLQDQALQALLLWKMRFSKDATHAQLKTTLRECGLALIADSLEENIKYASA